MKNGAGTVFQGNSDDNGLSQAALSADGTIQGDFIGGDGDDVLTGTGGDDMLAGRGGADTLDGGDGNDTLYSGEQSPPYGFPYYGNPYTPPLLDTGSDVDTLIGGAGYDTLFAGYGDNVDGGADWDTLLISFQGASQGVIADFRLDTQVIGGGTITGIENVSWVEGSNFDDVIHAQSDTSVLLGMAGNDQLFGGYYTSLLDGGDGNDILDGLGSLYYLQQANGGAGDDIISVGSNPNTVASGGDGNDTIYSAGATHGGGGNDTIHLSFSYYSVQVTGDAGDDAIHGSFGSETIEGNEGSDTLNGGDGDDTISGNEDDDTLDGGGGQDFLNGGAGTDVLSGGSENDRFLFEIGGGHDLITDFAMGDSLEIDGYVSVQSITQVGSDVVVMLSDTDQITLSGTDVATVEAGLILLDDPTSGTNGDDILIGTSDADVLNGRGGQDIIAGAGGADTLDGGDGNDTLYSGDMSGWYSFPYYGNPYTPPLLDTGSEVDTLVGGAGYDTLFAGYGDNVDGGADFDTLLISFQGASQGVIADFRLDTQVIGGGTITGIENVSWIEGSNFDDVIHAQSYTNVLFGMGGNDQLVAGYYTGVLDGGDGNDVVDGRGSQYLQLVEGGAGDDILYTDTNTVAVARGGDGNDTIYSHGQTHGGAGNDTIILSWSYYPGRVNGDEGDDQITGSEANDTLGGGAGTDVIDGGYGDDVLFSGDPYSYWDQPAPDMGTEHDVLTAGGGNDTLNIGYGDDADGGEGTDTLRLSFGGAASGVTFDTSAFLTGQPLVIGGGTIQNVEAIDQLTGSNFADRLTIAFQQNPITIEGLAGNDVITTAGGAVTIYGGDGRDRVNIHGDGVTVFGGEASDSIYVYSGTAVAFGGGGDDYFVSGSGADTFFGDDGSDMISYRLAAAGVTVSLQSWTFFGGDQLYSIEGVEGSAYADTLTGDYQSNYLGGGAGNDILEGLEGDDTLDGAAGNDVMRGGAGNDFYLVDSAHDVVTELANGGLDIVLSFVNYKLGSNVENGNLEGTAISLKGNSLDNELTGNASANTLEGMAGNDLLNGDLGADLMIGGTGNDTFIVDDAGDKVIEDFGGGNDEVRAFVSYTLAARVEIETMTAMWYGVDLTGNELSQTLLGGDVANVLNGAGGADTLFGRGGDDVLIGGAGNDILWGGGGADKFAFEGSGRTLGSDWIMDFQSGIDQIDLHAFGISIAQVKAAVSGSDTILSIDTNSDGRADFTITLSGVGAPDAGDYIF